MARRRSSTLKMVAVLGLGLACSIPTLAEKHEPAPQWALDAAKVATPASAKDASAVVLSDEYLITVDEQNRASRRRRVAVRILKPQGRSYGNCGVGYDVDEKLKSFHAWTITSDGHQFQAMESDFTDYGTYSDAVLQYSERIRSLKAPSNDPGSVVACETEELFRPYMNEEDWGIQGAIPVVDQALELDLPSGGHSATSWHKYAAVKPVEVAPNHLRWEIKDMPALDLENQHSIPAREALEARMTVKWGDLAVEGNDQQWRAIGQWMTTLEDHRPDPTPEITAKAQELTAGAPDLYTKLSRITDYIQKSIRYFIVERGIGGYQAHPAAEIYLHHYGDCKDKTTLLISMLQAVGIHAVYMPVDHRRGVVDPDAPSIMGDHMITAIEIPAEVQDPRLKVIVKARDGKRYLIFDPTNERTVVGNLHSNLQGGYGILAAGPASQIVALPVLDPDANGTEQKGSFTLSPEGTLSGAIDTLHTGPDGADWRLFLKYTDDKERREYWEHFVASTLPGVTLDTFQFLQPSDLGKPLEFHYKVTAPQYAHHAGPLLLVRPRVVGTFTLPLDDKPRLYPIDLGATGRWRDSFDIKLPDGYVVDETPDPVDLDLDFASYHATMTAKSGVLHYEREYVVRQVEIPAARVADLHKLEGAILFDEKGAAVLKKQ